MKIIQINAVYGFSSTGTIMKLIHECALQNGIDSYVAYPRGAGLHDSKAILIGNKIDRKIHALLSRIGGRQAYFSHFATIRLIRQLEELRPDIIHLHNLHSNYINLNILLRYIAKKDIPTVITMHDCWYFTGGCFHYTSVGCAKWQVGCGQCPKRLQDTPAYIYDASRKIIQDRDHLLNSIPHLILVGCSEWIADECRKSVLKDKTIISIHNGFNLDTYKPTESDWRTKLGIERKSLILGPASKWLSDINRNTFDYFVNNIDDNTVLVLFGSQEKDNCSNSKIRHIGYINNPDEMAELYSAADVFVNCSREDTLSSINIEAQACGTPVVAYDATGNKETVGEGCGFTVPSGDFRLLFDRTSQIIKNRKESYSDTCVSFIRYNYERDANLKHYIDLYNRIYG